MGQDSALANQLEVITQVDRLLEEAFQLRMTEQWDRILELAAQGRALAEQAGYCAGVAKSIGLTAFVHYIRSDLHVAIEECMMALSLAGSDGATEGRLRSILAMIYWSLGHYAEMARETERAMELTNKYGLPIEKAFAFTTRGGMFHSLNDYEKALEDHLLAAKLFAANDFEFGLGRAYAGAGAAYLELGYLDEALEYQNRSLDLGEKTQNKILLSRALNDLGAIYARMGDNAKAFQFLERALAIREKEGYRHAAITSLIDLGRLHLKTGDVDRALAAAQKAQTIALDIGVRPKLADAYLLLSEVHERRDSPAEALRLLKTYHQVQDQMAGEQTKLRRETLNLTSQLEHLRASQSDLVNTEKMAALGSLVAALAHEMNSPLGVIQSAANTTLRATEKLSGNGVTSVLRSNAEVMTTAAKRLSVTVNRLKSFAGLDFADYREADLLEGLNDAAAIIEAEFGGRISLLRDLEELPRIACHPAELNQVFLHLLRNAAEAIDGSGTITISARHNGNQIRLSIRDTGRGIPREMMARLFNPGFNFQGSKVHASLSLFSCLNIVQKHNGTIAAASEPNHGSEFTILLPINSSYAKSA